MKGKLLLGLTIATLISANSFALEIYKGKVIKHKEWSTGGAKGSFVNAATNPSHLKLNTASAVKNGTPYLESMSFGGYLKGTTGQLTQISGNNEIFALNNTETTQTYNYTLYICAETTKKDEECTYYFDELSLEAGGYAASNVVPTLNAVYFTPGTYNYYVGSFAWSTDISSGSKSFDTMSDSHGTIDISANKG